MREVMAPCFICHRSPKGAKLCTSQLPKHTVWEEAHFSFQHVEGNHVWREGATRHLLLPGWGGPSCSLTYDSSYYSQPCTQEHARHDQVGADDARGLWELRYRWPGLLSRRGSSRAVTSACKQTCCILPFRHT